MKMLSNDMPISGTDSATIVETIRDLMNDLINDVTIASHDSNLDDSDGHHDLDSDESDYSSIKIIKTKSYNDRIETDPDIEVLAEIVSPEEVTALMHINLRDIQDLTQLSYTTIRILMDHYNWNRIQLVNDFLDLGIQAILNRFQIVIDYEIKPKSIGRKLKTYHKNNQLNGEVVSDDNLKINGETGGDLKTCLVCMDVMNKYHTFAAKCDHTLCIECWNQYIVTHVKDNSLANRITCPADNCHTIIDDDYVIGLIRDPIIGDKYRRLISRQFVAIESKRLRWCPNGDCLHAVRVQNVNTQDVDCVCKTVYCFQCGDEWHESLPCDLYKKWIQKYATESVDPQSANWLKSNAKCCPKCQFPIEKSGGCHYIVCTKCRHAFCYTCLGNCFHSGNGCSGVISSQALAAQATDRLLKDNMQSFLTLKNQYQNHLNQLSLERKLQQQMSEKLVREVKCPVERSAFKFAKSAFTVLCHSRQMIMYSHVFRYYVQTMDQQLMNQFEEYMRQLETKTDELSRVLVSEVSVVTNDVLLHMKSKVQLTYRSVEDSRATLVSHIRKGMLNNVWTFKPL